MTTTDFEGPVVERGDPSYEQVRRSMVWNARVPDRNPEVIVRAASDGDVAAAVRLARARGLRVAVRSGGHSWGGAPLRDGTVLVDLSGRRIVHVDEASGTAVVEPATTGAELAARLEGHGLAFPVGHCASVGLGGYLLSGGLGWNGGAWGPACASVLAVDVVTPDGDLVDAGEDHEPELLWAARGAGPGMPGVVTRFHLALHPLPRAITTTTHVHDLDDLDEVAAWVSAVAAGLPPTVELTVLLAEAGLDLPAEPARRAVVVTATAFADTVAGARADLAPLTASPLRGRALAARDLEPSPFPVLFRDFGGRWREGSRFASDNAWTDGDLTEVLPLLRDGLLDAPSASSFAFAGTSPDAPEGGEEEALPDMAFSLVARSFAAAYSMWDDPGADEANLAWPAAAMARLGEGASGHYVAEADLQAAAVRASASYTPEAWARLQELRHRLDPDGLLVGYLTPEPEGSLP